MLRFPEGDGEQQLIRGAGYTLRSDSEQTLERKGVRSVTVWRRGFPGRGMGECEGPACPEFWKEAGR